MELVNKKNYKVYNKVYNSLKDAHDYPNTNLVRLSKWYLSKKGKILDYGFGYGENSIFLANNGYSVYATEISKKIINYAKRKSKIKSKKSIKFFYIDEKTKELPFKSNSFDNIICLGVIQYLGSLSSTKKLISEFSRCLKKKGKIIISTFGPQNTFIKRSNRIKKNVYIFKGLEKFHNKTKLEYKLYIPETKNDFKNFFPSEIKIDEVGNWGNDYCGINGLHFVALGRKIEK